jgi:hypothetical protein
VGAGDPAIAVLMPGARPRDEPLPICPAWLHAVCRLHHCVGLERGQLCSTFLMLLGPVRQVATNKFVKSKFFFEVNFFFSKTRVIK